MNRISSLWTNFTNSLTSVTIPAVAWETFAKEVIQLTTQINGETLEDTFPATYRVWVYPVDLNDEGAIERDIAIGYGFMSHLGDIFSIIAVNEDYSIDVSDDSFCGYCPPSGRLAIIYSSSSPIKPQPPKPVINTRWIEIDLQCVKSGTDNTGIQTGISKKQIFNKITNLWEDTGEQSPILRTNLSSCPLPTPPPPDPYRASMYVGLVFDTNAATEFSPNIGGESLLETQTKAGQNYLFLSIPTAFTNFVIRDGENSNITASFKPSVGVDNKIGFQGNTVYKQRPWFSSSRPVPFSIIIK